MTKMKQLVGLLAIVALGMVTLACKTETSVLMPNEETPGVNVSGSGSAFGEPDIALLSLGVSVEADTVGAARTQASDGMDAMLEAMKTNGVEEKDIQTSRFSVQPVYDYPINASPVLRGFIVDNMVTAKVRTIDNTGDVIDAALEAGGNLARIESLSFTIDDPSALEDTAREEAMAEARRKAQALATAGGVELGAPRTITESGGARPIPYAESAAYDLAQGASISPVQLGELEVQVEVQVIYELND
jgi:uncharacterized protein YggE